MRQKYLFSAFFVFVAVAGALFGGTPPKSAPALTNEPTEEATETAATVRVIDGDTILVKLGATTERVRLIGVNTPESVDPRKMVECFGTEAAQFTKTLLPEGATITLVPDPTQGDRDKYDRLLRYVFLPDGALVNQTIIAMGYGYEYTYHAPYKHQEIFKKAEQTARENKKGLWADGACAER